MRLKRLEARVGIEPTYKGFADLSLTTWVPRPILKLALEVKNVHPQNRVLMIAKACGLSGEALSLGPFYHPK